MSPADARPPRLPPAVESARELAPLIDHTLLRPGASADEVARACDEALRHRFAGVCVREEHLALVVRRLAGSGVLPIAVCDFPRGDGAADARAAEARRLAGAGAAELDVVFPLPLLARRAHAEALADLAEVVRAAGGAAVKVILEAAGLGPEEQAAAAAVAQAAGAAFVKTSTGFGPGGAREEDVARLRAIVAPHVGVKASGGIRTAADALRMVRAGASRIGTSAGVAIVGGAP